MDVGAEPKNEVERLHALTEYRILDTAQEGEFDQCAKQIAQLCGTQIGAVTLIDQDRQWMKAVHGPLPRTIPRQHAFCAQTILQDGPLEVPDALLDPRFLDHPCVKGPPFVRFYVGVALQARDGLALGTLCVMDSRPQRLKVHQLRALEIAASYLSAQLEIRLGLVQLLEQRSLATSQREAIERANKKQKALAELLVHDLRSPLTAVTLNASYLMEETDLSDDQKVALGDIIESSGKLTRMVNEVLRVSRGEDGQLMIQQRAEVNLSEVVRSALSQCRALAAAGAIQLEFEDCPAPAIVEGDSELLFRVVTNLLDNACKYSPRGSSIRAQLSIDAGCAVLRVEDQGPGIPSALRLSVFEKYFQVEPQAPSRPGYGLGLSFSKLAVEAHGGSISVEEATSGCSFRVALPLPGTAVVPANAVQVEADLVLARARQLADGVLKSSRAKEDEKHHQDGLPARDLNAVQHDRALADQVLDQERSDADDALQQERDGHKTADPSEKTGK